MITNVNVRNPAPVDRSRIPVFTGFYTFQVVGLGISEPSTSMSFRVRSCLFQKVRLRWTPSLQHNGKDVVSYRLKHETWLEHQELLQQPIVCQLKNQSPPCEGVKWWKKGRNHQEDGVFLNVFSLVYTFKAGSICSWRFFFLWKVQMVSVS